MNPLLQVEKLDFTYDSEPVLKNVGFSVNKMEFIGLIGPNGSGKSTLLKLMGGVLSCDQGEIFYNNRPTKSINKKELARSITWIPQEHPMVFPFTIQEIVLMGRHPYLSPLSFEGEEDYRISRPPRLCNLPSVILMKSVAEKNNGSCWQAPLPRNRKSCYWTNLPLPLTLSTRSRF